MFLYKSNCWILKIHLNDLVNNLLYFYPKYLCCARAAWYNSRAQNKPKLSEKWLMILKKYHQKLYKNTWTNLLSYCIHRHDDTIHVNKNSAQHIRLHMLVVDTRKSSCLRNIQEDILYKVILYVVDNLIKWVIYWIFLRQSSAHLIRNVLFVIHM